MKGSLPRTIIYVAQTLIELSVFQRVQHYKTTTHDYIELCHLSFGVDVLVRVNVCAVSDAHVCVCASYSPY
jgi:hypothetical protein